MSKKIGSYTVIRRLAGDGEAAVEGKAAVEETAAVGGQLVGDAAGLGEAWLAAADGREWTLRVFDVAPSDERVERAQAETLACAALHHPAVALVADIFEHEGRTVAVSPAPVDGGTLEQLMVRAQRAESPLDTAAVWHIATQIAAAITLAHSTEVEGDFIPVCHGHLSPRHVSVGHDGSVRVEGLGLAPLVGEPGLSAEDPYTAPEQQNGGRITPRGDVYSIAAIVWHLLSGEIPRDGMKASDVEVPESFRDAFTRALEPKVGNRRITGMELEQFFKELGGSDGKQALVDAMALLQRGATLLGHGRDEKKPSQPPQITPKRKLGGALGGRGPSSSRSPSPSSADLPPIRSKQQTLLGTLPGSATPGQSGARAVPPMRARQDSSLDWDAASKSASDTISPPATEVVDELSWGMEDEPGAAIADEDSDDEEMTMMNPAGAELRAAMDEAKKASDADERVTTLRPDAVARAAALAKQEEETTLVTKRKNLEANREDLAALAPSSDDWEGGEETTKLRSDSELPEAIVKARKRLLGKSDRAKTTPTPSPTRPTAEGRTRSSAPRAAATKTSSPPTTAASPTSQTPSSPPWKTPPSSRVSVSGPPRPKPSRPNLAAVSDEDTDSSKRKELSRTLASAGVDEFEEALASQTDVAPATKKASSDAKPSPIQHRVIDIDDEGAVPPRATPSRPGPGRTPPPRPSGASLSQAVDDESDDDAPETEVDSAASDSAASDAAASDAGTRDAGINDAADSDAGISDVAAGEAGISDAGPSEARAANDKDADARRQRADEQDPGEREDAPNAESAGSDEAPAAKPRLTPTPAGERVKSSRPPVDVQMDLSEDASVAAQAPGQATGSPWLKDEDAAATDAAIDGKPPLHRGLSALIIVVTAVAVMVVGTLYLRRNTTVGPAPSLSNTDLGASATPSAKPSAKPSAAPAANPSSATSATPAPSADPSAAASASAAPSASGEPPGDVAPPAVDASQLPMTMGYLTVMCAADPNGIVSVLGRDIGKVGAPNQVGCNRPAFVRIKSAEGRWITGGQTVTVKCRDITTIEARP